MTLTRHTLKWLTRLMLGVMLFAQGVVAANACVLETGPTHAYTMSAQAQGDVMMDTMSGHCHEEDAAPANANACLAQNTQADQVSADHVVPVFALPASVVLAVPVAPEAVSLPTRATLAQLAPPDTGPPLSIRFCSLLN